MVRATQKPTRAAQAFGALGAGRRAAPAAPAGAEVPQAVPARAGAAGAAAGAREPGVAVPPPRLPAAAGLLQPGADSLRSLQRATELGQVQAALGVKRASLGCGW